MSDRALARIAAAAAVATWAIIVAGGVVRVTGSGMGCPDWPKCFGQWIPPADVAAWIEFAHRVIVMWVSPLIGFTAGLAWFKRRTLPGVWPPAAAAFVLLTVQIGLGAVTVLTRNRADTVTAHLVVALAIIGALTVVAVRAGSAAAGAAGSVGAHADRTPLGSAWTGRILVGLALAAAFVGSLVQTSNGGFACPDLPLCGGAWWPAGWPAQAHVLHRLLVVGLGIAVAAAVVPARRSGDGRRRRWAGAVALLYALQFAVGAGQVVLGMPTVLRGLHLALGAAFWAAAVGLAALPGGAPAARAAEPTPATMGEPAGAPL